MPSRKKAKGKARKAKKAVEAANRDDGKEAAAANHRQRPLELGLQRLQINDSSVIGRDGICAHMKISEVAIFADLPSRSLHPCKQFIGDFKAIFYAALERGECSHSYRTAYAATRLQYREVWEDATKMELVIRFLLSSATVIFMMNDKNSAKVSASLACYFEEMAAATLYETKASPNFPKVWEMCNADDHTLVSFLKKRIPCCCLDKAHKDVKSVKKMGLCWNDDCTLQHKETGSLFQCVGCLRVNYCCVECQKADWPNHKIDCRNFSLMKAAFDSRQK